MRRHAGRKCAPARRTSKGPLPTASGDLLYRIGLRRGALGTTAPQAHSGARERLLNGSGSPCPGRRRQNRAISALPNGSRAWKASSRRSHAPAPACRRGTPALRAVTSPPFHHLRLHIEVRIIAIQGVIHGKREVARDVRRGPDRIERGEVGMGVETMVLAASACTTRGAANAVAPASAVFRDITERSIKAPPRICFMLAQVHGGGKRQPGIRRLPKCAAPRPPRAPPQSTYARRHARHRAHDHGPRTARAQCFRRRVPGTDIVSCARSCRVAPWRIERVFGKYTCPSARRRASRDHRDRKFQQRTQRLGVEFGLPQPERPGNLQARHGIGAAFALTGTATRSRKPNEQHAMDELPAGGGAEQSIALPPKS